MVLKTIKGFLKRHDAVTGLHKLLIKRNTRIFSKQVPLKDLVNYKKLILFVKVFPYTQSSYARLSNAYELARNVEESNLEGSFVECGVWRGGCSAVMAVAAKKFGRGRKSWLFDSFEGMPEAGAEDEADVAPLAASKFGGKLKPVGTNVVDVEGVKNLLFNKLRLDEKNINIKKGWFQDTLPKFKGDVGPISVLRLDGDYYESTKVCLDNLFDSVVNGGYVIIDDYVAFKGCSKAVNEFLKSRNLKVEIVKIDDAGVFFQK